MKLFVELAPRQLDGRSNRRSKPRTHEVELPDVPAFKKYAYGQIIGNKAAAWAIVKTNADPSSEGNALYFIGVDYDGGKFKPFEHIYDKAFAENKKKEVKPNA